MYEVDLIITLWDRTEGHANFGSQIIPKILEFVNYPCRVVVQIDQPTEKNLQILNNLKNEGKIHELYIANHPPDHRPCDINSILIQAFSHIKNKWVVHFDGDMLLYRRGYDNWLEKFIQIIESHRYNIGAICHSAPRRRDDWISRYENDIFLKIKWVSTRFFVTEAETVLTAIKNKRDYMLSPVPGHPGVEGNFEGHMYSERIEPLKLSSIVIPFNPDFLIVHVLQLCWWEGNFYDTYIREIDNKNDILLKNIMSSNSADLYGDLGDIGTKEIWGSGTWNKIRTEDNLYLRLISEIRNVDK